MSEHVLTILQPTQVSQRWPEIRALLAPVEPHCHGELIVDDVLKLVLNQRAFVLALMKGNEIVLVGAFEIVSYPRKRVLNLIMVGGSQLVEAVDEFYAALSEYAKCLDATAIRGFVRPSVARLMRRAKSKPKVIYSVVEMEVC